MAETNSDWYSSFLKKASCTERKGRTEISKHLYYTVHLTNTAANTWKWQMVECVFCRLEELQVSALLAVIYDVAAQNSGRTIS